MNTITIGFAIRDTVGTSIDPITVELQTINTLGGSGGLYSSLLLQDVGVGVLGVIADDHLRCRAVDVVHFVLDRSIIESISCIAGIDECLKTFTISREALDHLLVSAQSGEEVLLTDVVEEYTLTERRRHGGAEKTVSCLQDGLGALVKDVFVELCMVDGKASTREQCEDSLVFGIVEKATHVGKCSGVRHVNGDGVAVTKWHGRDEFVQWRPSARQWVSSQVLVGHYTNLGISSFKGRRLTCGHMQ